MGIYADTLLKMVEQVGKPKVSTTTLTTPEKPGTLDLGPLFQYLMMLQFFGGNKDLTKPIGTEAVGSSTLPNTGQANWLLELLQSLQNPNIAGNPMAAIKF